jgi:hypothetical protein
MEPVSLEERASYLSDKYSSTYNRVTRDSSVDDLVPISRISVSDETFSDTF